MFPCPEADSPGELATRTGPPPSGVVVVKCSETLFALCTLSSFKITLANVRAEDRVRGESRSCRGAGWKHTDTKSEIKTNPSSKQHQGCCFFLFCFFVGITLTLHLPGETLDVDT